MTNWNSMIKRIGGLGAKVAGLSAAAGMAWWGIAESVLGAAWHMEVSGMSSWAVLTPLCMAAVGGFLYWLTAELSLVVQPPPTLNRQEQVRRQLGGSRIG